MRRLIRILVTGLLLAALTGCSNQRLMKPSDIDFTFSCKVGLAVAGQNMTCTLTRNGPEDAELRVLSGGLEGMGCNWNGNGFVLTYQGLAAKSDSCVLPQTSFAKVLIQVLDCASKPGALTRSRGNEFSGKAQGDDFTLTSDPATGRILSVSVPERGINAGFSDYGSGQT